ncbi:RNA polymerase sigma factor SigX [Falsibacillus albus]|uniref:RNA polymerase sigma factor n=1 Tax=Falsibacillus albus TaxID=2478915 RepID=A0A3L7JWC7_9BACI|nr:RNA polymerase sigma factor SigX [Falsibacillus albus]RLQ95056.1 RNA polymerase sigma factor SigX [Falsibacillus albus]
MDSVFKRIYTKYHQDVFQFLIYMVKNRELAEDLVQEVYIRVLKSYQNFEGKSSEKTWLFSIARNVAIDYFRKQKGWRGKLIHRFDWSSNKEAVGEHQLPDEIAMQNETIRQLYAGLDQCSTDQKSVIIMRYLNDLTIYETAEVLGWTESKVKTTQHRALKKLKKVMNSYGKEGDGDGKTRLG